MTKSAKPSGYVWCFSYSTLVILIDQHSNVLLEYQRKMFLYLVQSGILPTRNSYVECECNRLGEFAVVEDVERGYGWTLSAGLIAAFVAVSQYSYLSYIMNVCTSLRWPGCYDDGDLCPRVLLSEDSACHQDLCHALCLCSTLPGKS